MKSSQTQTTARTCCCSGANHPSSDGLGASHSWIRRGLGLVQWIAPGAILTLMPKCPLCLASYFALATGVGISISVATSLQWLIIAACIGSFGYLLIRTIVLHLRRHDAVI